MDASDLTMKRTDAIVMLCDAAKEARRNPGNTLADETALGVMAWTTTNMLNYGDAFCAGTLNGILAIAKHITPPMSGPVQSALFMMSETLRFDAPVPGAQIDACRDALLAREPVGA